MRGERACVFLTVTVFMRVSAANIERKTHKRRSWLLPPLPVAPGHRPSSCRLTTTTELTIGVCQPRALEALRQPQTVQPQHSQPLIPPPHLFSSTNRTRTILHLISPTTKTRGMSLLVQSSKYERRQFHRSRHQLSSSTSSLPISNSEP